MPIDRRNFLGSFGAASLAAAFPPIASEAATLKTPATETWDMSWVAKLTGKYKAVFDSPGFSGGAALFRAVVWSQNYKSVYGTAPTEMSAVLVVRHQRIWLAMNDLFWKKYDIGKRQKLKDTEKKQWYTQNPIASTTAGPPAEFDINIPKFISAGNIVLGCHLAFEEVIDVVMKEEKLKKDDAEKMARTYLIPGIILQPSGVFAVLHAQDSGCHYILAS